MADVCKVYYGLVNEGSTCYLNAVLQTLFMTKDYRKQVKDMSASSGDKFIEELKELFNKLETEKKAVSAKGVRESLGIPDDKVDEPRDAAEYLHEILNKTPKPSKLFKGTVKTTITCSSCGHGQESLDHFLSLTVSFKDSLVVEDALNKYVDQMCEKIDCHNCQKKTAQKSETFNLPKLLIIQLSKSDDQEVIIRPQIKVSSLTYELYAIVNYEVKLDHSGHPSRHYYVNIECECRSDWRQFDDHRVSKTDSGEIPPCRSKFAYLLVYRHRE